MSPIKELPLTSTHWGTYRARVSNGRVQDLLPFEHDQDPSLIGTGILDVQDGPTRIHAPMVRKSWLDNGPGKHGRLRGIDPFVEVTWDEAERLVSEELSRVIKDYGNSAIYAGSYGWASAGRFHHAQSQLHRFLNCIGGYTKSKFTYSFAAAEAIIPYILGSYRKFLDQCTSWDSINDNTELFICFGGVPLKNGQISQGGTGNHYQRKYLLNAARSDISFVNISPIKSDLLDEVGGTWLPIRPNTDAALLLGIAHTLQTNQLINKKFLDKYTSGYEKFLPYLLGDTDNTPKSASWASKICEIEEKIIISLAQAMAKKRTMISVSWSLTRQDHGEQAFWAAITVSSMLGQIGLPGGGFGFGYSATNYIGGQFTPPPAVALPQGKNPISSFIPVARVTDLLLSPNETFSFNGSDYSYPETKIMYWAGGNPFHHHQDLNRLMLGWEKPDTIISHEWCWNALAKRSDIVLPCTTPLERKDISLTPRDPYVISMDKLTEPFAESRDDFDIFCALASQMGVEQDFTENRDAAEWTKWIYEETKNKAKKENIEMPEYEQFIKEGWFKIKDREEPTIMLKDFCSNPMKHKLATESGKIEIFSNKIANFRYDDCPGHPMWREPYEWLGDINKKYPLHLISNQPRNKLHSQLDHGKYSRSYKINGREPIHINPKDAKDRNLGKNDLVRVFNDRGSCFASVVIDSNLREGVIQISTGAWYDPVDPSIKNSACKNGNPNVLTRDIGTSKLGQGPTAHSCLVEVQLEKNIIPEVTAYDPPQILKYKK